MGEFAIFDRSGIARFFISESVIYDYSGRPVAFLEGENIASYSGKHLGWFHDGFVRDANGDAIGFTERALRGPITPIPAIPPIPPIPAIPPIPPFIYLVVRKLGTALCWLSSVIGNSTNTMSWTWHWSALSAKQLSKITVS